MSDEILIVGEEEKVEVPLPEQEEEIGEIEVEYTSRAEYISSAYSAISAVEGMDTQIMSKEDAKRVRRIIRKSLMIIDDCITEMYDELYEKDEDENE
jgi:hypothetical protein